MSSIHMHTGMFTDGLMAFTVTLIPAISWSLFPAWLLWDDQSMMYKSEPRLNIMCTLNWCIHSIMHHNICNNMDTSLLSVNTSGL